jgi:hypothetical protein
MDYVQGEKYSIPCAEITIREDSRVYYLPVIDLPHSDPAFDFPHHHYHIDGRFDIHPRMKHRLGIHDGFTLTVILTEGTDLYSFNCIVNQLTCEQKFTGLAVPPGNEKYLRWYRDYIGRSCAGRKCPHLGTAMLAQDGRLVCPLHGLTADTNTLKICQNDRIVLYCHPDDQQQVT